MLSPYITPSNLNGALLSTSKVGEALYGSDKYDALDKRSSNLTREISSYINSAKAISDTIENASGSRSPLYKIGEISRFEGSTTNSPWVPNEIKGLVRAVYESFHDNEQEGVIIDGLGDANGEFAVNFTSNPVLFRANKVIDNRFREPSKLTMTVMVSNYLNDNLIETTFSAVNNLVPSDYVNQIKNELAYNGNTRAQAALYSLRQLMENGKPFHVYTPHGVYENMLIKSIKPQTDAEKMDMLYCIIEFQEMILYTPLTGGVGSQPARKSVSKPRSGLTSTAVDKIKAYTVEKLKSVF